MIDISLCGTTNCPLATTCYRKLGRAIHVKSYVYFIPHITPAGTTCIHYVEVANDNENTRTKNGVFSKGDNDKNKKWYSWSAKIRQTTWKAAWREIGGIRKFYRSKWEANYGYYLQWLKENGHIKEWLHEPKVFWFDGVKRGCVSYLPDFWVKENDGSESYHEVKGWMDDRSKTKIKRMAKYHPSVKLIVIDSKCYTSIKKKVEMVVPGWEP